MSEDKRHGVAAQPDACLTEAGRAAAAAFPAWTVRPYRHWSSHVSLYSAKTRAYLIKKGVNFVEATLASDPHWREVVSPQIGYFTAPVLETPEGAIISDSTAIITWLERAHPAPVMQPADPVMRALSWLIFNFGTEGLFLAAQHYRWSFPDSAAFAAGDIARGLAAPDERSAERMAAVGQAYQTMKMERFEQEVGITPSSVPAIEAATMRLFDTLNAHFIHHPYILGGRPCIADCALMEALHGHLGRDPDPAHIMKTRAPALYRWTETMNRPGVVDAEFSLTPQEYFTASEPPDTLIAFLRLISAEFGPFLTATMKAYEDWLARNPDVPEGALIADDPDPSNRQSMGQIEYPLMDAVIRRDAWPDVPAMHQAMLDVVDGMTAPQLADWRALMGAVEGEAFLTHRSTRRIVTVKDRPPYAFVLGPKVG